MRLTKKDPNSQDNTVHKTQCDENASKGDSETSIIQKTSVR